MKYIILSIIIFSVVLTACSPKGPAQYDDLAKCMTEKGAVMYGTEWCPHCKTQKATFGDSFQYITYVDCDANENACLSAGVKGYPTWVINGSSYPGSKNVYDLAKYSGCVDKLPAQ